MNYKATVLDINIENWSKILYILQFVVLFQYIISSLLSDRNIVTKIARRNEKTY